MRRTYTLVDLIRFAAISKERKDLKPIEVKKLYDELYPELSSKQKYENLLKALGLKGDELKRAMEIQSDELRDKGIKSVCPKCDGKGEYYKLIPNGMVLVDCDCKKQTAFVRK